MAAVFDETGNFLGDMPTEREQLRAFIIQALENDHQLKFSIFNHFNSKGDSIIDAEVVE